MHITRRRLYHVRPHIVPERVPANISMFRVAHAFASPVIRDSVRRALRRAKVTGCDFYLP